MGLELTLPQVEYFMVSDLFVFFSRLGLSLVERMRHLALCVCVCVCFNKESSRHPGQAKWSLRPPAGGRTFLVHPSTPRFSPLIPTDKNGLETSVSLVGFKMEVKFVRGSVQ